MSTGVFSLQVNETFSKARGQLTSLLWLDLDTCSPLNQPLANNYRLTRIYLLVLGTDGVSALPPEAQD